VRPAGLRPRRCYATAATADTGLDHSLRRYATCVRMTSDGWKDAYCDELHYFACKKPTGALSTPRLASLSTRQNERSDNVTERPHRPPHLPAPLRPLSLLVSGAVAVTRCPCGQVCSPVLLRRLLLTQSNAFQSEEQPPKLPIILGDRAPT